MYMYYTRHLSTNNHNLSRLLLVLHGAARQGHRDVVKILLERGAEPAKTNKSGETLSEKDTTILPNGFRSLCSLFLFLSALDGGALCQIRSKLRISTRDHIFEHEFSKKNFTFIFIKHLMQW